MSHDLAQLSDEQISILTGNPIIAKPLADDWDVKLTQISRLLQRQVASSIYRS